MGCFLLDQAGLAPTPLRRCAGWSSAFVSPRRLRRGVALLLTAAVAAFAGCGGDDSDPREQHPDPAGAYLSGDYVIFDREGASDQPQTDASAGAKGAEGLARTSTRSPSTRYQVSASGLTGPYLVSAGYVVATTRSGNVNSNELTSLQSSVALGQDSFSAYTSYGEGSALVNLITDANLKAAQAKVVAFVKETLDVDVPDDDDLITTPFAVQKGDPIYDTLLAMNVAERRIGYAVWDARVAAFVQEAGDCLREKISLTIGGKTRDFCPSTKTAERETADESIIDYVFTAGAGDALTVRVQGDAVLDARYVATSGGKTATCSGKACSISLGKPDANDETRAIAFKASRLDGSAGKVVVDGTLVGAQPGVVLPTLPCSSQYFYLVLPDRSVLADCAANNASVLGLTGSFGSQQGGAEADAQVYAFDRSDPNAGIGRTDDTVTVNAIVQKGALLSVTVTRSNQATGELTLDYKCRLADCNGVTVGPETTNGDSGFNATLSTLTFDRTRLARVEADGSLAADAIATLSGTFNTVFISAADFGGFPPVQASDCAGASETVTAAPSNESSVYAICPELGGLAAPSANALTLTDGSGLRISFPATLPITDPLQSPITFDYLFLLLDNDGRVRQVTYSQNNFNGNGLGETFGCVGDCGGVTVSAPDAHGRRSVVFENATFHIVEPDGFATDPRTASLNGSFAVPPAVPQAGAAMVARSSAQVAPPRQAVAPVSTPARPLTTGP